MSAQTAYPLEYPPDIPSGLAPAKCTGCGRLWWTPPPPESAGHCMCCKAKLRFLIAGVERRAGKCICEIGTTRMDCPVCGIDQEPVK